MNDDHDDGRYLDPTWPYEDVESHEAIGSEPTWECASGFCACPGGHEHDVEPTKFSILLCDEHARRMPNARVRVLADGILANEDQPYADGKGHIELTWRRLPELVLIEWAPESTPLEPRYPFRKRHYVDLSAVDREEAARRRLHNLGYAQRPDLEGNIGDFQRAYARRETGKLEDEETRLIRFNDDKALPPLPAARTRHHVMRAAFVAADDASTLADPGIAQPPVGGAGSGGLGGAAAPPPAIPLEDITLEVFVRFEAWNVATHTFVPIPDMAVQMLDEGRVIDSSLDRRVTDAGGMAHFIVTRDTRAPGAAVNLTFVAKPDKRVIGGVTFPDEWRTKGWKSTNGEDGLQRGFSRASLGTAADPIVFRVGLDFHLRITYAFQRPRGALTTGNAVEGVHVALTHLLHDPIGRFLTDRNGEIHGLTFLAEPGDSLVVEVSPMIRNPNIGLPLTKLDHVGPGPFWWSSKDDADSPSIENNQLTSIGSQAAPREFKGVGDRAVCMYVFKVLSEWSEFLTVITDGAWKGIENLTIFPYTVVPETLGARSSSIGLGNVNLASTDRLARDTIAHELSHQIMWKEAGVTVVNLAESLIRGHYNLYHQENMLLKDGFPPLVEGWAEIIEAIFTGQPYNVRLLNDGTDPAIPLGPPPADNRGERCEGAFANGMFDVYRNFIGGRVVAETNDGRIDTTWISRDVKDRWRSAVWAPLQELKIHKLPKTRDFLDKLKSMHPADWHRIAPHLHRWNMMMDPPTVTSLTPASGPAGAAVDIVAAGTEFVATQTTVSVDGTVIGAVDGADVRSSTEIRMRIPPGAAGDAVVEVKTKAGSASLRFTRT
ncbi:Hypothetical protein A7982_03069 [Minicystis rosea]|nr:Hypothetical protein A7982_03069 [Minicystis rosea]